MTVFGFHSTASLGRFTQNRYAQWVYLCMPLVQVNIAGDCDDTSPIYFCMSISKKTEDDNDSENEIRRTVIRRLVCVIAAHGRSWEEARVFALHEVRRDSQ